jgi:hypothetical protein
MQVLGVFRTMTLLAGAEAGGSTLDKISEVGSGVTRDRLANTKTNKANNSGDEV